MPSILLVEDDPSLQETISRWLEFNKHSVGKASTGQQALEKLDGGGYDLVLLDWNLPDMAGVEVLKKYRADGGSAIVIMMTGMREEAEVEIGMSAGASDYLTKPFTLPQLSDRIALLLQA